MSGSARNSEPASGKAGTACARLVQALRGVALSLLLAIPATAGAPQRVVSINLCTDQLALLLAAPGQLISVSALARDPMVSALAVEAQSLPANHGQAEEVFLLHPDLVLAGTFTTRATVDLLRRLGIRVETFPPIDSLAGVREAITAVGAALGREGAAAELAADFDAGLAELRADPTAGPRAALYYANGYTTGTHTLAAEILAAAGFANVASELGLEGGGALPLERLILARPDAVITGRAYPGASRSEEILHHPALRALMRTTAGAVIDDADWICGTPAVLRAVAGMAALRASLPPAVAAK